MSFRFPDFSGTWREVPFIVGQRYRVIRTARSHDGSLTVGESLKYLGANYGHYDEVSVYVFVTDSGEERTWMLYDDQPLELWSSIFQPLKN